MPYNCNESNKHNAISFSISKNTNWVTLQCFPYHCLGGALRPVPPLKFKVFNLCVLLPSLSLCSQINSRDASGQTPLHRACERGDTACVTELLEESQARTDIKDQDGETPMHCAAKQDTPAIIKVRGHCPEETTRNNQQPPKSGLKATDSRGKSKNRFTYPNSGSLTSVVV